MDNEQKEVILLTASLSMSLSVISRHKSGAGRTTSLLDHKQKMKNMPAIKNSF